MRHSMYKIKERNDEFLKFLLTFWTVPVCSDIKKEVLILWCCVLRSMWGRHTKYHGNGSETQRQNASSLLFPYTHPEYHVKRSETQRQNASSLLFPYTHPEYHGNRSETQRQNASSLLFPYTHPEYHGNRSETQRQNASSLLFPYTHPEYNGNWSETQRQNASLIFIVSLYPSWVQWQPVWNIRDRMWALYCFLIPILSTMATGLKHKRQNASFLLFPYIHPEYHGNRSET